MFKDIPGYEGLYQIDECGNVLSLRSQKLMSHLKPDAYFHYPSVRLSKDGHDQKYSIHRLVAMTHVPNPDNLPVVMHKDNNKNNFNAYNLKWGTSSENNSDAYKDGMKQPLTDPRTYYEIYNDEDTIHVVCKGREGIVNAIGYGTLKTAQSALIRNSKFSKGNYEGCRVCKINYIGPPDNLDERSTIIPWWGRQ